MTMEFPDNDEEYPEFTEKEIDEASEFNLQRAGLMAYANQQLSEAKERRMWKPRETKDHESGWTITLHDGTEESLVGLWSCWLNNAFYLGYPKQSFRTLPENEISNLLTADFSGKIDVPDELICKILGLERAKPVKHVDATAVNDFAYKGECKDPDKELAMTEHQVIAYSAKGMSKWAKFYGPRESEGGRVWVDKCDSYSNSYPMPFISKDGELKEAHYGHSRSKSIVTFPFSFCNPYAPEGPTADPRAIQRYKHGFMQLLAHSACIAGNPAKITIDYGFAMVPEDLEREDYKVTWLKGKPGVRNGWGNELVKGEKSGETIMLKSANSAVPWVTLRQFDITKEKQNPEGIYQIIKESLRF
jgi:hypothetical protein